MYQDHDRPKLADIHKRVMLDLGVGLIYSSRAVFAKAIAGCAHLLYGYAQNLAHNLHPLRAKGDALDLWAKIWLPEGRKPAVPARGTIILSSSSALSLPAGTIFTAGGLAFKTSDSQKLTSTAETFVTAVQPGKITPLYPGDLLTVENTVADLESFATVSECITGGADRESDESLRERIIERVRNPPQGGAPLDYILWAKEVPGVSQAWVAPRVHGLGTVGLAFIDHGNHGLPTKAAAKRLEAALAIKAPAATQVKLLMLKPQALNFELKVRPNTAEIRSQIETELKSLIANIAEPVLSEGYFLNARHKKTKGILTLSQIHEALSFVHKDEYKLLAPSVDVATEEGRIFTWGGLDVQGY